MDALFAALSPDRTVNDSEIEDLIAIVGEDAVRNGGPWPRRYRSFYFFVFFRRRDRYGDLLQRLALTWRRFG